MPVIEYLNHHFNFQPLSFTWIVSRLLDGSLAVLALNKIQSKPFFSTLLYTVKVNQAENTIFKYQKMFLVVLVR